MTVVLIAVIVLVLVFAIWFISVSNTSNTMKESNTSNTMKENYLFEYVNENEFRKLEGNLKKYNMLAYKELCFDFYPSLKEGKFIGEVVDVNEVQGTTKYELKLPTDIMFSKAFGDIKLHYTVYEEEKIVMLDKLTPEDILTEEHQSEFDAYKCIMASKQDSDIDFMIKLLNMIKKK